MEMINKIKSVFKKDDDVVERALLRIISKQAFEIKRLKLEIFGLKNEYNEDDN